MIFISLEKYSGTLTILRKPRTTSKSFFVKNKKIKSIFLFINHFVPPKRYSLDTALISCYYCAGLCPSSAKRFSELTALLTRTVILKMASLPSSRPNKSSKKPRRPPLVLNRQKHKGKVKRTKKSHTRRSRANQSSLELVSAVSTSLTREQKRMVRDQDKIAKRPKRPRYRYTPEDLDNAVVAFQSKQMTLSQASESYHVPRMTIYDKAKEKHPHAVGRPFLLPENVEQDLADLIRSYCGKGNVLEESYFLKIAKSYVEQHEDCAGVTFNAHRDWLTSFLQRNDLKRFEDGTSKSLGVHRMISTSPDLVGQFISKYRQAYNDYIQKLAEALQTQPVDLSEEDIKAGIFAIDETAISNGTPLKYEPKKLVGSDVFCLNSLVTSQSSVSASLLEIYSASGRMPFHVLTTKKKLTPNQRKHLSTIDERSELLFCDIDSGNFDSISHAKVLERIGLLRPGLPSLVIQDCPNTHKSDISILKAKDSRIHLMCLPHNSSWWLQVPDDLPFAVLKSRHYSKIKEFKLLHHRVSDLMETLHIFLTARKDILKPEIIQDSFERCGQFPFSERAILLKAERARQRCGTGKKWKETDDLSLDSLKDHPLKVLEEQLESVQKQVDSFVGCHRTNRVPANLRSVMDRLETAQEAARQAWASEFSQRASSAQTHIDELASQPIPEDPTLFLSHSTFDDSVSQLYPPSLENKTLLDGQHHQMQAVLKRLSIESAQQLNAEGGSYLVNPNTVTPREREMVREKWVQGLKTHRKFIRQELKTQSELLKTCLNPSCGAKKGRQAWQKCSICQRGYCRQCTSRFPMIEHLSSAHPGQVVTTSVTNVSQTTTTTIRIPRSAIVPSLGSSISSSSSVSSSNNQSIAAEEPRQESQPSSSLTDDGYPRCPQCCCLVIDASGDCQNCLHLGFANSDSHMLTSVVETSHTITETTITTVRGFCLGCGLTRTLNPCTNNHLRCRTCIINCHECQPQKRRHRS